MALRGSIWQSYAHILLPSVSFYPSCFFFFVLFLGLEWTTQTYVMAREFCESHKGIQPGSFALLSWHGPCSLGAPGLKIPGEVPLQEQENGFCSLLNLGRNMLQTQRNVGDFLRVAEITNYIGLLQKTLDRRHNTVISLELGFN